MEIKFEPTWKDIWVGVYWKRQISQFENSKIIYWDIYACFLPCLPIHFSWITKKYGKVTDDWG